MPLSRRELFRRLITVTGIGASGIWRSVALGADPRQAAKPPPRVVSGEIPVPPPTQPTVAVLWDGDSGASADYYNIGALLPWENRGGDWEDAHGVAQGPAYLATVPLTRLGAVEIDLSPHASLLDAGIYLRGKGAAVIATRRNSDPAKRPVLVCDGVDVACTASAPVQLSSSYAIVAPEVALGDGKNICLTFAMSSVPTRAKLRLTVTRTYSTGSVDVFLLRPAELFDGGTPVPGLAAKYSRDAGVSADPDVYFSTRFDDNWRTSMLPWGSINPLTHLSVAPDATLGVPALSTAYIVGRTDVMSPDHSWSYKRAGTLPRTTDLTPWQQYWILDHPGSPDELYFRYYLKLGPGYQCSIDGKKLPGLAWRYGHPVRGASDTFFYYVVDSGNGGAPSTGRMEWSASGGYWYLSGGSMRHHAYVGPSDANPLAPLIPLNYYAYHAEMKGFYGDYWRWGSAQLGYVNIEEGRWYCIEHRVKMNDVIGPFDAQGNGTGVANGIVQGWLDGVLVFDKRDAVLRKHPAIKVDEVWLDHYHGGTRPAESPHPFAMAALVVAKSYIGPMREDIVAATTPLWLQSKPRNEWIAIAGTEVARMDCSPQAASGLTNAQFANIGYGDPRRGICTYSGGTLKKSGSEMLIFGGGGAGAWAGNDVRGLRLEDDTPVWRTRVKPSPATNVPPRNSPPTPYMIDGVTPNARHSYWTPQFVDSQNKFMVFGCVNTWNMDSGVFYVVDGVPLNTGQWEAPGSHPNIPIRLAWDGNWVCKHPDTDEIYVSGAQGISKFSPASNTWSTVYVIATRTDIDRGTAAIDPAGNGTLLRIGNYGATNIPLAIDLTTGIATVASFSGPYAAAINIGGYYASGLVFDRGLGKFLLFQDDGRLYTITKITMANWNVDRLPLSGVAPDVMHSGGTGLPAIWGRMQYVPNLKGVCIVQAYDRPAYFVRTT